jgi:flagellum-specific ATP synthase
MSEARDLLAIYRRNEDLINLGAYNRGVNARIDRAIEMHEKLTGFLRQRPDAISRRSESLQALATILR